MEARTFRARTTAEALRQIRRELGADAVILSTKKVPPRTIMGDTMIEVIAALPGAQPAMAARAPRASNVESLLSEQGVLPLLSKKIANEYGDSMSPSLVAERLAAALSRSLPIGRPRSGARVMALVGPTGVGKTTTVAKLATLDCLRGLRAGLITIDHHRIGGVEQLRTYANLAELPMAAPTTPEALAAALRDFSDLDRIYIDTAGCGLADHERLQDLERLLGALPYVRRLLLVPASGNHRDLDATVRRFMASDPAAVCITKVDETCYFGPSLSAIAAAGLPIELLTTGQNVPEDVEWASASKLAELLCRVMQ